MAFPFNDRGERVTTETQKMAMAYCRNWFARLVEYAHGVTVDGATITQDDARPFVGGYRAGDVLRIHGSYTSGYGALDGGEVYDVAGYDSGVLTLDRPVHTRAGNLLIVYCEVPADFAALCERIAAWESENGGHRGLNGESIDGYSWSAGATGAGFDAAFAAELSPYIMAHPTQLYYARLAQPWR